MDIIKIAKDVIQTEVDGLIHIRARTYFVKLM